MAPLSTMATAVAAHLGLAVWIRIWQHLPDVALFSARATEKVHASEQWLRHDALTALGAAHVVAKSNEARSAVA
jgi:hypothetical protein